jgi:hypothetical protein
MGDRVAFIGGSISGRDHFPFPIKDASVASGFEKFYPISVGISNISKWFWRVKQWRIDGSITFSGVGLHATQNVTWSFSSLLVSSRADYREVFLVGLGDPGNDDDYTSVIDTSLVSPSQLQTFTVGGSDFFTFTLDSGLFEIIAWQYDDDDNPLPKALWDGGNFKPTLFVRLNFSGSYYHITPGTDAGNAVVHWNTDNAGSGTAGSDQTLPVDGVSAPLKTKYDALNSNFRIDFVSHNLHVTPADFFPYATKPSDDFPAGEDVYDTATGAQLRDPLS